MKTLVLVPTYNERENLPILVADILTVPGTEVMVLDDQSPDGTGAVPFEPLADAHRQHTQRADLGKGDGVLEVRARQSANSSDGIEPLLHRPTDDGWQCRRRTVLPERLPGRPSLIR
jgi:dolichol-phosphate mannosyltransferase